MFNDRDLGVIGVGAVLSVLCLLLPVTFSWKVAAGFFTLVLSIVAALVRLGRDGLTIEEWIYRRVRYRLRPRFWTYYERKPIRRPFVKPEKSKDPPRQPAADLLTPPYKTPNVSWDLDTGIAERAAGILLVVVGLYFLAWLHIGGARILGAELGWLLP